MMNNLLNARKLAIAVAGGACIGLPLLSAGMSGAQGMNSTPQQSLSQSTQASPYLNPCPGIYYEEPFNSTRVVPPGCPANDATVSQQQGQELQLINATPIPAPTSTSTESPISIPTATSAYLNPCPGIYYEEPFNSTRAVPQGCPANSATLNQ